MHEIHSHCSYCGRRFPAQSSWPRQCGGCGNRSYLNPLPVAVVLMPVGDGLVVIRRNTEPRKGTLTLPGGYIDLGETWQEAGVRELREETGMEISGGLKLFDVMNGLDGTLVIFGLARQLPANALQGSFSSEETQEVVLIERPIKLGFSMHTEVMGRYFEEKSGKGRSSG